MSSDAQLKINKIAVSNFRGVKNLSLDLSSKDIAIFGMNGEGKSTFTQAVEWFYRGKIAVLTGKGSEGITEEDIVNISAQPNEETIVDLKFSNPALDSARHYLKGKTNKHTNNSKQFEEYFNEVVANDRIYLDHHTILWLLLMTKGEKKEQIAKIVGYEDIVKVRDAVSSTLSDLERSHKASGILDKIANNDGIMTTQVFGEPVNDLPTLFEKSRQFLEVFGLSDTIATIEDLNNAINKAFNSLPSEQRAKDRIALEQLKTKISQLLSQADFIPAIETWSTNFNELAKDRESVAKLNYDSFLRQAETILRNDPALTTCPLCEQTISNPDDLLHHVVERYKKLIEIGKRRETLRRSADDLKQSLRRISQLIAETSSELETKKIPFNKPVCQTLDGLIKDGVIKIEESMQKLEVFNLDTEKISNALRDYKTEIGNVLSEITTQIQKLSATQEEEQKQTAYHKLTIGKDFVLENIKLRKQSAAYKKQIEAIRKIDGDILRLQNEAMAKVLSVLSKDIDKYFCFLNQKEKVKDVRLELKGEEGIEFSLAFYDRTASPPKKYLSESQMNSLGIALFLAAVKNFNKGNKFFILDDVLLSFDKDYRLRLLELLHQEFKDYQVFLFTHEEYWFQMIKRKFTNWVTKQVCWNFDKGVHFKEHGEDWIEELNTKIEAGHSVGNDLRIGVENLLKEVCHAFEVKLPFRFNPENEKRMTGELFSGLTGTLNKYKCDIKDSSEYKNLGVSNFVTSAVSHDNPDADSPGDMRTALEMIRKFKALFVCPKGKIIHRKNKVHGQKKISCECGCLQPTWDE